MTKHITGFRVAGLIGLLMLIVATLSHAGYGQTPGTLAQSDQCAPFQWNVRTDISANIRDFTQSISVAPNTKITIEQVALLVVATNNNVVPSVAALTTTVGSITNAYYLPIPVDQRVVGVYSPLQLMQAVRLHPDGGSNVGFFLSIDSRYLTGSGRAEWSVSGLSCTA